MENIGGKTTSGVGRCSRCTGAGLHTNGWQTIATVLWRIGRAALSRSGQMARS
jgi:hypothetical protein